ncbi:MAG: hypothetical protein O2818_05385 [Bacteroidetes bacterium]|nr:hypothetical protein [Bacteroidota bacterium]MDA1336304.1 hypothetical protein [Bacteroidota bacterium]
MAFFWNPNSLAEIESETLVLRIPSSGFYARVEGPILELLSQLPFEDVEEAVEVWQDRCGRSDLVLQNASVIWHELCDLGVIHHQDFIETVNTNDASHWISLDSRLVHSRLHRFMDAQDFLADDDFVPMGA